MGFVDSMCGFSSLAAATNCLSIKIGQMISRASLIGNTSSVVISFIRMI